MWFLPPAGGGHALDYDLTAHVPRLVLEWQTDAPGERYRAIEGTLAFTDLSGFTVMSERLARKGKVGAEEVSDILNSTFEQLLAVAYEADGTLLKFGGDALLLFFSGSNHALRAAYAVDGMMRTLKRMGRIRSSAGVVSLKMSVGVESGLFHFYCVGDSHKDLLILGPQVTRTLEMESAAEGGEILLGPCTAELLGPDALGARKTGGRLLARAPELSFRAAHGVLPKGIDPAPFVPKAIREHLLEGGHEPEHRRVTIAFLRFGDTDALLKKVGPERLSERLHDLVASIQTAVEDHQIAYLDSDVDKAGGKILLTAGVPRATENDEERMLRAVRQIADHDHGMEVKIGVNRGPVFAGAIGPPYRRSYTTIGDTTNTAARVMGQARPGQVLATTWVVDNAQATFETTELPSFVAKGKKQAVPIASVGQPLGERRERDHEGVPLVGRERELQVLLDIVDRALEGRGSAVEIVGEPGMGKSRLLREVADRRPDPEWRTIICDPYQSATPYFAFRVLVRALLGMPVDRSAGEVDTLTEHVSAHAPELTRWLPLLGLVVDVDVPSTPDVELLDPDFRRMRLNEAADRLLATLLPGPTVLVFEDAQWLDDASIDLVRFAVAGMRLDERPWTIVLTTRPERESVLGQDTATTVGLGPLEAGAAAELAKAAAEDMLLPHQAAALAERAAGNALYLLELVDASRAGDDLAALPDSVDALIAARIDGLAPRDRNVLRLSSVLGNRYELPTLVELVERASDVLSHPPDLSSPALWERLATFLDRDGTIVRFRQPLFRQVAYEGLPYRRRRTLHERLGRLLEERPGDPEEHAALLSVHFHEAHDFERSWRYSVAAAKNAAAKFAHVDAAHLYRRALDAGKRLRSVASEELVALWEELGLALLQAGEYQRSIDAFRHGRRLAAGTTAGVRLLRREAVVQTRLGHQTRALRALLRGLRSLEESSGDREATIERVRVRLQVARIHQARGQAKEAIRLAEMAVDDAQAANDRAGLGHAYNTLHDVYSQLGDPARTTYGRQALEIFEEVGDLRYLGILLNALGADEYVHGRWTKALALYRRALKTLEQAGNVAEATAVSNNVAEILSDQGHTAEAIQMFVEVYKTLKAAGYREYTALALANRGRAEARSGSHGAAAASFAEAIALSEGTGIVRQTIDAFHAESLMLAGEHEPAIRASEHLLAEAPPALQALLHRVIGYAHLGTGDRTSAEASLSESLNLARASGTDYDAALALLGLAELGEAAMQDAEAILDRLRVVDVPQVPLPAAVPAAGSDPTT